MMTDIAFDESWSTIQLVTHFEGQFPFWFTSYRPRLLVMQARKIEKKGKAKFIIGDLYDLHTSVLYSINARVNLDHSKGWQPVQLPY